jgi:hypothetical protein
LAAVTIMVETMYQLTAIMDASMMLAPFDERFEMRLTHVLVTSGSHMAVEFNYQAENRLPRRLRVGRFCGRFGLLKYQKPANDRRALPRALEET